MLEYIKECIELYIDEIKKSASTPAIGDLFDKGVGEDAQELSEK